jgi:hypothetical protein
VNGVPHRTAGSFIGTHADFDRDYCCGDRGRAADSTRDKKGPAHEEMGAVSRFQTDGGLCQRCGSRSAPQIAQPAAKGVTRSPHRGQ